MSVRRGEDDLPIVQGSGANSPQSLFDAAGRGTLAPSGVPLLIVRVVGDSGSDTLVRRRALIDVSLGDVNLTLRPNDGGSFVTYASVPGVVLKKGDRVGATIRGKGLLDVKITGAFDAAWDGNWPVAVGDDHSGLEVRALPSKEVEAVLPQLGEAVDAAISGECRWAISDTTMAPAWSPLSVGARGALKELAALNGWDDPRVGARLDRIARIEAEWRAELAALVTEIEPTTPALGTPTSVRSRTLTVLGTPTCDVTGLGVRCRSPVSISGDRPLDARDGFETPVLHADGTTHAIRLHDDDKDGALVLEWSPDQAPAAGEVVLYRPDDAEGWVRLQ